MQSEQKRPNQTAIQSAPSIDYQSIILIEEHQLVRNVLAQSLETQLGLELALTTPYLPSRPNRLLKLAPKVILIGLPQRSVTETQTMLQHIEFWALAGISIVILATYIDPEEKDLMIQAGAYAYVHKMIDVKKLGQVISMALMY